MKINKFFLSMLAMFIVFNSSAKSLDETFRSNQKYYVVAAVLTIIFGGIAVFLLLIEKRLRKLEK